MRMDNQRKSQNIVDRTDDTPVQKFLTTLAVLFNPYTAAANIGQDLRNKGVLPQKAPKVIFRGRDKR